MRTQTQSSPPCKSATPQGVRAVSAQNGTMLRFFQFLGCACCVGFLSTGQLSAQTRRSHFEAGAFVSRIQFVGFNPWLEVANRDQAASGADRVREARWLESGYGFRGGWLLRSWLTVEGDVAFFDEYKDRPDPSPVYKGWGKVGFWAGPAFRRSVHAIELFASVKPGVFHLQHFPAIQAISPDGRGVLITDTFPETCWSGAFAAGASVPLWWGLRIRPEIADIMTRYAPQSFDHVAPNPTFWRNNVSTSVALVLRR